MGSSEANGDGASDLRRVSIKLRNGSEYYVEYQYLDTRGMPYFGYLPPYQGPRSGIKLIADHVYDFSLSAIGILGDIKTARTFAQDGEWDLGSSFSNRSRSKHAKLKSPTDEEEDSQPVRITLKNTTQFVVVYHFYEGKVMGGRLLARDDREQPPTIALVAWKQYKFTLTFCMYGERIDVPVTKSFTSMNSTWDLAMYSPERPSRPAYWTGPPSGVGYECLSSPHDFATGKEDDTPKPDANSGSSESARPPPPKPSAPSSSSDGGDAEEDSRPQQNKRSNASTFSGEDWPKDPVEITLQNFSENVIQFRYKEDGVTKSGYLGPGLMQEKATIFAVNTTYGFEFRCGREVKARNKVFTKRGDWDISLFFQ